LVAAQAVGVGLVAICGGHGVCGTCRVRLDQGELTQPTDAERSLLTSVELAGGQRLACQARTLGDCHVHIPPDSLTTAQRLVLEGEAIAVAVDPPIQVTDVDVPPPQLDDLRSDATRLAGALQDRGLPPPSIDRAVLAELPGRLRAQRWSARAAIFSDGGAPRLAGLLPTGTTALGLAVDLGTTKLAAYLVRLDTGRILAQTGAMNPQIAFGEDVLSRITRANESPATARQLQELVIDGLDRLVDELCQTTGRAREAIVDAVVVGNTAMHHLFAGLPVRQLGEAPYVPAVSDPVELLTSAVGLALASGATCYLPPIIAGFVGADHVAMLLASGVAETERTVLALDIGTNTEISLAYEGRLWSCSTASGPAFEGAHIRDGMRAAPGAIEHVRYIDGTFLVQTIDDAAPVGVCGSGILDAVAEARRGGIIDGRGALSRNHPLVSRTDSGPTCVVVPAERTGHGHNIGFTRSDVNEIQLAKGAIRAGIEVLLATAAIDAAAVDEVVVAGAFGTYLDLGSAIGIGMLPDLPRERYRQVGNAAGRGAQQLLCSRQHRVLAQTLARRAHYIELTVSPDFTDTFVHAMQL
jgi:uncharacterized 2Fe-2S/4Fe-4S cluster protein (DUF4445 family)